MLAAATFVILQIPLAVEGESSIDSKTTKIVASADLLTTPLCISRLKIRDWGRDVPLARVSKRRLFTDLYLATPSLRWEDCLDIRDVDCLFSLPRSTTPAENRLLRYTCSKSHGENGNDVLLSTALSKVEQLALMLCSRGRT